MLMWQETIMGKLCIIAYAMYLFCRIDQCTIDSFISKNIHTTIRIMYLLFLLFYWIILKLKQYSNYGKITISQGIKYLFIIILVYCVALFNEFTSITVDLGIVLMLFSIYLTSEILSEKNKGLIEVMFVSYLTPLIYMLLLIFVNHLNVRMLLQNVNISIYFSSKYQMRYRYEMGFYSPNVLGSIMECALCVSVCLVSKLKEQHVMNLFIGITIGLGDIFIFSIILITGSRSAMIGLFVFLLLCSLFYIEKKFSFSPKQIIIIKISIMFIVVFLLFTRYFQQFWFYYLHSGRDKAYENLKFLNTFKRRLFGIGLPEQDMSIFYIDGMRGNILDNYYIYTLVSTGIIGTILICSSIIKIGISIYKLMKTNSYIYVFFACFAMLLIYGMAETCVLWPAYVSSEIYFTIFMLVILQEKTGKRIKRWRGEYFF